MLKISKKFFSKIIFVILIALLISPIFSLAQCVVQEGDVEFTSGNTIINQVDSNNVHISFLFKMGTERTAIDQNNLVNNVLERYFGQPINQNIAGGISSTYCINLQNLRVNEITYVELGETKIKKISEIGEELEKRLIESGSSGNFYPGLYILDNFLFDRSDFNARINTPIIYSALLNENLLQENTNVNLYGQNIFAPEIVSGEIIYPSGEKNEIYAGYYLKTNSYIGYVNNIKLPQSEIVIKPTDKETRISFNGGRKNLRGNGFLVISFFDNGIPSSGDVITKYQTSDKYFGHISRLYYTNENVFVSRLYPQDNLGFIRVTPKQDRAYFVTVGFEENRNNPERALLVLDERDGGTNLISGANIYVKSGNNELRLRPQGGLATANIDSTGAITEYGGQLGSRNVQLKLANDNTYISSESLANLLDFSLENSDFGLDSENFKIEKIDSGFSLIGKNFALIFPSNEDNFLKELRA